MGTEALIAALFVATDGPYFGLPNVDPWDEPRDARLYQGPYPVVAHPPCERWGRYATGGPNPQAARRAVGDDAGCFASAVASLRRFGGVLEHPEATKAWPAFGIAIPPRAGYWVPTADGYTCCVEQGNYGHAAVKPTWLYVVGVKPWKLLALNWTRSKGSRIDEGFHSKEQAKRERESVAI